MVECCCTVEDVLLEGGLEKTPELVEKIGYKVENISRIIDQITCEGARSKEDQFNARMFCVYNVLAWLESLNIIPSSNQIAGLQEGGTRINYATNTNNGIWSYLGLQHYYLGLLLGKPPVASTKD
jgi:hypothetical protein